MLKKTIIAAALLGLASNAAASKITVPSPAVKSEQGILTSVGVAGATFTIDTDLAIASGSTLQVTFSHAPTNAAKINAGVAACGTTPTVTYSGSTNDGKTLNYTVANANNPATLPVDCAVAIGSSVAPVFSKADTLAGPITATASWTVVGTGVDPVAAPKAILSMLGKPQYGLVITTPANAVVDVEDDRFTYVSGTTDVIELTYKDYGGGATDSKAVITLTGDFAWIDDPLTAAFDVLDRNSNTAVAISNASWAIGDGVSAPKPTATTISIFKATPADGDKAVITFKPLTKQGAGTAILTDDVAKTALPSTAFTAALTTSFTDEVAAPNAGVGTQVVAAASAGAWGLNGASVKIYAVPFGSEVESHSIFVSNKGATTGAITGSVSWNGNAAVTVPLGNVEPKANKYINLMSALDALGEKPPFGRADVTMTVNSPAADIAFTAAYTTATGRANLFMQEQANIATISNAAKTSSASAATSAATAATSAATAATDATCAKTALSTGNNAAITQSATAIGANQIKFVGTGC